MANLIKLKQIESGSSLQTSAQIGTDFSASVNEIVSQSLETTFSASIVQIITNNVGAVLPDGVVSSSAQITLADTIGQITSSRLIGDIVATSVNYEDIIGLPTLVSGSTQIVIGDTTGQLSSSRLIGNIAATSVNYEDIIGLPTLVSGSEQIIDILIPLNQHSASLNQFTASLDGTFATDVELAFTTSHLSIDMGEF
jgi:hypothetical protein